MMKFALFLGCNIPARVQQYELSTRAVCGRLGIEVVDLREFKCCGYPIRNMDNKTFVFMSARNIALAEKQGLNMMVLCKCCYGSLKKAAWLIRQDPSLQEEINTMLATEGLEYSGKIEIKHILSVLYDDIGIKALKEKRTRTFKKLNIATHYGCHALRPSEITQFDDPAVPVIFDKLVESTGSTSIDWPLKLDCCGAPVLGVNDGLSTDLAAKKLANGKQFGANYICVACPYCQMQFDSVRQMTASDRDATHMLPGILFPQLLGLSLGISGKELGMDMNGTDISDIESFLEQE